MLEKIRILLQREEGLSLKPYRDTRGFLTIGYGRNLDRIGLSQREAEYLLNNDLSRVGEQVLKYLSWFPELTAARQAVIVSMAINLGVAGLLKFPAMIAAIEAKRWALAAAEMLNSKWREEVGDRALELAVMMHTGEFPAWVEKKAAIPS